MSSSGGAVGDPSEPPDKASPSSRSMSSSPSTANRAPSKSSSSSTAAPPPASSTSGPPQQTSRLSTTMSPAEVQRVYYRSYDVMTGVRIAATLGGFFTLVVVMLLYKSKCKPSKQYHNTAAQPSQEQLPPAHDDDALMVDDGGAGLLLHHQPAATAASSPFTVLPSLLYDRGLSFDGLVPPIPQPGHPPSRLSPAPFSQGLLSILQQSQGALANRSSTSVSRPSYLCEPPLFMATPSWSGRRRTSTDSHLVGARVRDHNRKRRSLHVPMLLAETPVFHRTRRTSGGGGDVMLVRPAEDEDDFPEDSWRRKAQATQEWVRHIDINVIQPTPNASPCGSVHALTATPRGAAAAAGPLLSPSSAAMLSPRMRRPSVSSATTISSSSGSTNAHLSNMSSSSDADLPSMGSDSVFLDYDEETAAMSPPPPRKKHQPCVHYNNNNNNHRLHPGGSPKATFLRLPSASTKELSRSCEKLARAVGVGDADVDAMPGLCIPLPVRSASLGQWEQPPPNSTVLTGETGF